jgi:hypothetical protein
MRLKLIGCEVLYRELCEALARGPHQTDIEFLPKGIHDLGGEPMREEIQRRVDAVPQGAYDAILLGYGLCGMGLNGLTARHTPLVLPRAHDCIALLLGSRERYQEHFESYPGTYYRSTGWLERGQSIQQIAQNRSGAGLSLSELVAKYGEDNGQYLYEELTRYRQSYSRLAFIATGLEADNRFEEETRWQAAEQGWRFEKIEGDLGWLRRLLSAEWREAEFLVVQPGERVRATWDNDIVRVEEIRQATGA